jgi:hypothetical protein
MDYLDYYGQSNYCSFEAKKFYWITGFPLPVSVDEILFDPKKGALTKLFRSKKYPDYSGWILFDINYDSKGRAAKTQLSMYNKNDTLAADFLLVLKKIDGSGDLFQDVKGNNLPTERFYILLAENNQIVVPEEILSKDRAPNLHK